MFDISKHLFSIKKDFAEKAHRLKLKDRHDITVCFYDCFNSFTSIY